MTKRREKMIELVKEEAKNLRKYSTKEEKNRLDFKRFNPDNQFNCIYGLMTTHCKSARAVELIEQSCPRVYLSGTGSELQYNKLNGSPLKHSRNAYWSAIETFILQKDNVELENNNSRNIINYIKGITNRLNLK